MKVGPASSRILGQKFTLGAGNDSGSEEPDFGTHQSSFPEESLERRQGPLIFLLLKISCKKYII